ALVGADASGPAPAGATALLGQPDPADAGAARPDPSARRHAACPPIGAVTTVFLLDGSDSVSLSQRARAEGFIAQALEQMPGADRAAIGVFGQRALVERIPSGDRIRGQVAARPGRAATNVGGAIQLRLALLPDERQQ